MLSCCVVMHVPILLWQCMYPSFYGNACTHPSMAMHVPILLWQCMYPAFYGNACTQPSTNGPRKACVRVPTVEEYQGKTSCSLHHTSCSPTSPTMQPYITLHAALHHIPQPCSSTSHTSPAALHHTPHVSTQQRQGSGAMGQQS